MRNCVVGLSGDQEEMRSILRIGWMTVCFLVGTASAQEIYDLPSPQTVAVPKVRLWTFRGVVRDSSGRQKFDWNAPALRSNRKIFRDPWFLVSNGAVIASMAGACSRKGSGEHWDSEAPAMAAVVGLNFLTTKYLDELYSVGASAWATQHYIRSASR